VPTFIGKTFRVRETARPTVARDQVRAAPPGRRLQRTLGNQAVQRMFRAEADRADGNGIGAASDRVARAPAVARTRSGVVQRQPQDVDELLRQGAETVESLEEIRKQLALGKEHLEILRWRLVTGSQKLPRAESPVSTSTTAVFVEALIEASPFLEPYLVGRLVRTRVADRFTIYDFRETFEEKRDTLDKRVTPMGGRADKRPYGFYHRRTDSIHLPSDAKFGHALHEGIHKYSSVAVQNGLGVYFNEGVTQYFTNRVLAEHPELGTVAAYDDELACARIALRWINDDVAMFARAYFGGEVNPLATAVRQRLNLTGAEFSRLANEDEGLGLCRRITAAP
jgi:hypothetical protein